MDGLALVSAGQFDDPSAFNETVGLEDSSFSDIVCCQGELQGNSAGAAARLDRAFPIVPFRLLCLRCSSNFEETG